MPNMTELLLIIVIVVQQLVQYRTQQQWAKERQTMVNQFTAETPGEFLALQKATVAPRAAKKPKSDEPTPIAVGL